jgi:hypothetical protein
LEAFEIGLLQKGDELIGDDSEYSIKEEKYLGDTLILPLNDVRM